MNKLYKALREKDLDIQFYDEEFTENINVETGNQFMDIKIKISCTLHNEEGGDIGEILNHAKYIGFTILEIEIWEGDEDLKITPEITQKVYHILMDKMEKL